MQKIIVLIAFFIGLTTLSIAQQKTELAAAKAGVQYGKKINKVGAVSMAEAEKLFLEKGEFQGKIIGKVTDVCKMSGCFLALENKTTKEDVTVIFKNNAFIVPKDIHGKTVVLEGNLRKSKDKISMAADGVLVL